MATQALGLDFEVLRRAIEGCDAKTLVDLYSAAEVLTVNRTSILSSPQRLRGKEAIAEYR